MTKVAIAGVTGAVGQEFLELLAERKFPATSYKMLASARSAGKKMTFLGKEYVIEELTEKSFDGIDIALFSAGGSISKKYAPIAAKAGCVVVDNSSAFRMDANTPLVVPEINPEKIKEHKGIIANPNCSTIIGITPLWPLHKINPIKRLVVSTYQAVSGAGAQAMEELKVQAREYLDGKEVTKKAFIHQCAFNVFSHNSDIDENGYNVEEMKLVHETHKIFGDDSIAITCTCVRVPVLRAHCESINIEFTNPITPEEVTAIVSKAPGVKVVDDRKNNYFPMPLDASGQDDILVGRIRQDNSIAGNRGINLFLSGDQIRKGAALNAIQIAELLIK
ncbi:MAG: aspartate-semialdehyde dehydrogenase [Sedimentisphaerales bacterium]|nr:aspartate-semialdehyde dehydrogenase [Sedimentisphaerales bacterium]MBN2843617.1 aspartate-semialdehyde dehydrogenase [Sedimentisphaerales bacterium]